MTGRKKGCSLLAPKRRGVQLLCALLFLALPVVPLNGDSLLRLDIGTRTLHVFGATLRIVEFRLLLVAVLLLLFAFLLMTMVLGRVWCGWFCPQSALSDLSEWLEKKLSRTVHSRWVRGALREGCHAALSFFIAAVLLWYIIPAGEFLKGVWSGTLPRVAGYSFLLLGSVTYLNLALMRRHFCKIVCPYGRLQFFTMDRGTLTLLFEDPEGSCIRCGSCRGVCPMGIDIREGTQVACINCGRCLDACRGVMGKKGRQGLISYRFGNGREAGSVWGRRSLLAAAVTALSLTLVAGIITRPEGTLKVQHAPGAAVKKLPGSVVNFYIAYLENRGTQQERYRLALTPVPGIRCELLGPVQDLVVGANDNRRVDFAVQVSPTPPEGKELELHLMRGGADIARSRLPLLTE
ncbi:4Fe-4S binding protein [Geomonas sp. RF6]|uniref:4Fe-4S dicluster domain-containing protein n=1 Tax=Geomonas sp. RF6 TaxID=2897342 RepID=UPI001E4F1D26|nr:4Fe-4S dicluster domain-containing protein [Geomonas sp. RF6]UFS71115.1 4Fe-4S binding protein [Geomonas sp. RF6]